ncbi:MAG: MoaD/ThiS family protein [bacterium]|jgi:molybdopterin converting factor small subunit|nr:MoaD/ThiS family protein [bacterium]
MALVFIPAMMQNLSNGVTQVQIAAPTVRDIIDHLETQFPGFKERLLQDGDIRPDIAVAVDGEVAFDLMERVGDDSEVHFIPPISGGL